MPDDGWGPAVRRARLAVGLTQRDLATAAGLSLGALRDLEQGRSNRPRPASLAALSRALGPAAPPLPDPDTAAPPRGSRPPVVVRVLGPLSVEGEDSARAVEGRGQAVTLALLALHVGEDVSHAALGAVLWPAGHPPTAPALLRSYVARLRPRLSPSGLAVVAAPGRYRLTGPVDAVDVSRFLADLRTADAATDPVARTAALADALALWPSTPPTDLPEVRAHPRATALERERVRAAVRFAAAAVASGTPDRAVDLVTALAAADPLDESLAAAAVDVLAASGRMADVHAVYTRTRTALAADLGLDPGPELAEALRSALHREPADPGTASATVAPVTRRPAQLPRTLRAFHGRSDELARVVALLTAPPGAAPPVVVVSGMGGLGKTTLAVAAAHAVADRYPDGQVFADLDGVGEPLPPAAVLEHFLVSLGHDRASLPGDLDRLVTTFRTATAGARLLVVLDNAAGAAQVEPLLPAGPGCGVLVTSRRSLADLDDVTRLPLRVLTPTEAAALVAHGVGRDRAALEPAAVDRIVALCAGLPLALRMVVARLTANPSWRIADVAALLDDEHGRLDVLRSGGRAVRASFELSHCALTARAARVFRAAALVPGVTVAAASVAAALGEQPDDDAPVRTVLDDLVDRAVLADAPGGRYRFHDLLRAFADEQCRARPGESDAVRDDILRWLERTARLATAAHYPHRVGAATPAGPVRSPDLDDPAVRVAGEWLDTELETLVAAVGVAAGTDPALAWRLADATNGALRRATTSQEFEHVARVGLGAAHAAGDPRGVGLMADMLARAHVARCDHDEAVRWFTRAVEAAVATGWVEFEVSARENLGISLLVLGRHHAATDEFETALALAGATGQRFWEAACRNDLGNVAIAHGRVDEAMAHYRAALAVNQELADTVGYVVNLSNLANAERLAGRPDVAHELVTASLRHPHVVVDHAIHEEVRVMEAEVAADLGRFEEAADLAARVVVTTAQRAMPSLEARARLALARAALATGDVDRATREARAGLDLARRVRFPEYALAGHLALADAALAAGDVLTARRQALAAGRSAAHLDQLAASGEAALALTRVALAEGDVAGALDALSLATSAFETAAQGRGRAAAEALRDRLLSAPLDLRAVDLVG